jgi:hypothetical protein
MIVRLLGCSIGDEKDGDVNIKLSRIHQFCGTVKRTLLGTCQKQNLLIFCTAIAVAELCMDMTANVGSQ